MILIDGHNLIGKIPGIRLSDADDETRLIDLLQTYCRIHQRDVFVFFDGAAPGFARKQRHGRVTAIFIERGTTADDAMIRYLVQSGRKARNFKVVTSDHKIQVQARSVQAQVILSEAFADELMEARRTAMDHPSDSQPLMSDAELEDWLRLFQEPREKKKNK